MVGGYEKVYEICKDFRNEGKDLTHNPEFTMIEYYEAYADYQKVMDVTEGLFKHLAKSIFGEQSLKVGDKVIDISKKWPRIPMTKIIKEKIGLNVDKETEGSLEKYCRENKIELVGGESKGQLIFTIFDHKVTDYLTEPTWIIDYPKEVSLLSKDKPDSPDLLKGLKVILAKRDSDGWSELTDPQEQRKDLFRIQKPPEKTKKRHSM